MRHAARPEACNLRYTAGFMLTSAAWRQVICDKAGQLDETASISSGPIPSELEWGQVLVQMLYAPMDAADSYVSMTGGSYSGSSTPLPYTAGQHGIGSIMKAGRHRSQAFPGQHLLCVPKQSAQLIKEQTQNIFWYESGAVPWRRKRLPKAQDTAGRSWSEGPELGRLGNSSQEPHGHLAGPGHCEGCRPDSPAQGLHAA